MTHMPVTKTEQQDVIPEPQEEIPEPMDGITNQQTVIPEQSQDAAEKNNEVLEEIQPKQENPDTDNQASMGQAASTEKAPDDVTADSSDFVTVSWYHFKCKFCTNTFQDRKQWKSHLVKEHGVKPYVCMYCDERFGKKGQLKEHHRLHEMGRVPEKVPEPEKVAEPEKVPVIKVQTQKVRKRAQPKLKIIISEDTPKRKRGRPPGPAKPGLAKLGPAKPGLAKTKATIGRKRKVESRRAKKENDPEVSEIAPLTEDIVDSAGGRNKRKRGPVYRYVAASSETQGKRLRKKVGKSFQCSRCPRAFTTTKARLVHEKAHRNYRCTDCGEFFMLKRELKVHMNATHNKEVKQQKTKKEEKTKPSSEREDAESSDSDNGDDGKEDSDKDYEVESNDEEDDDEGGPFKCQFCPRMIKKRRNLAKHEKTHENGAPHTCPHCQKVYTRRRDLRRHMVRHTDEKPFQCEKCKKRFKHDIGLRRHMRLHTGEGLLVCQFCGKKYNGTGSLKAHERIHTGKCLTHCTKVFLKTNSSFLAANLVKF